MSLIVNNSHAEISNVIEEIDNTNHQGAELENQIGEMDGRKYALGIV